MIITVTIIQYILLGLLYWQAISLLQKYRGNSLLAIFAISVMTQGGLFWGYFVYSVYPALDRPIPEEALIRIAISLCLMSSIFTAGMVLFKMRPPRIRPMPVDNLAISSGTAVIIALAGVIFMAVLLASPASRLVIDHGTDVLGGEQYYALRGELVQTSADAGMARGRIVTRFLTFTYGVLLLGALVSVYKFSINKKGTWLIIGALFAAAPMAQALLSFQKSPLVTTVGIFLVMFLLFRREGQHVRFRVLGAVAAGAALSFLGVLAYIVFQGFGPIEAFSSVFERIFVVPILTAVSHATVYPDYYPYVRFGDFGMVRDVLPTGHIPVYGSMAREVAITLRGMDYNANTGIIGHAWGTWGYLGVALFSCITTGLFFVVDRFTNVRRHLASVAPLVVYYWFFFIAFGNSNLHNVLGASSLWILPFIYFRIFARPDMSHAKRVPTLVQVLPVQGEARAR